MRGCSQRLSRREKGRREKPAVTKGVEDMLAKVRTCKKTVVRIGSNSDCIDYDGLVIKE